MLRTALAALGLLLALALPASAATFESCSKEAQKVAGSAIDEALDLALHAAAAVGDTAEYQRWFGPFSADRGERVRSNLKAVHDVLMRDELKAVCLPGNDPDCKDGTYAYVLYDRPDTIHLCPSFFRMPSMEDAMLGRGDQENGTREGIIIHEVSHFPLVAHTADECYSRTACSNMARDAIRAVTNADSYQYYTEDVLLLFWSTQG